MLVTETAVIGDMWLIHSVVAGDVSEHSVVAVQERFDEMPEPKFLYGSHYSSPAHVLFFLARAGIVAMFIGAVQFRLVKICKIVAWNLLSCTLQLNLHSIAESHP